AAARPDNHHQLAVADVQSQVRDGRCAIRIDPRNIVEQDLGHTAATTTKPGPLHGSSPSRGPGRTATGTGMAAERPIDLAQHADQPAYRAGLIDASPSRRCTGERKFIRPVREGTPAGNAPPSPYDHDRHDDRCRTSAHVAAVRWQVD